MDARNTRILELKLKDAAIINRNIIIRGCGNRPCANPFCKSNPANYHKTYNDAEASRLALQMIKNRHPSCESFRDNAVDKKDILDILVAMGIERAYNVETVTEIMVRLQSGALQKQGNKNKKCDEYSGSEPPRKRPKLSPSIQPHIIQPEFTPHLTMRQASRLSVGSQVDYRDTSGRFLPSKVVGKHGTTLSVVYDAYKGTTWQSRAPVNYRKEWHRLATIGSVSGRIAHRFKHLEKGDFIDVNPKNEHSGWKCGEIKKLDWKSGQIEVSTSSNTNPCTLYRL